MIKYFDFSDIGACIKWIWRNQINEFEKQFAEYIGIKYANATSYGRTALFLGLKAINVQNREVIIPSFTCTVVRQAVTLAGGVPQFVDINFEDFVHNPQGALNCIFSFMGLELVDVEAPVDILKSGIGRWREEIWGKQGF